MLFFNKNILLVLLFISAMCSFQSCKSTSSQVPLSTSIQLTFLDSAQAASRIIQDQKESFFEQINILDMSIQMKTNFPEAFPRDSVLYLYKKSLQAEVLSFSKEEKIFIEKTIAAIYTNSFFNLNNYLDTPITFIKVSGKHYGASAYYTRENCIIIPQDELLDPDAADFKKVIIHELFHIYSRYHPAKRRMLYEVIGFKSIGPVRHLQITPALRERILLNPDGINYAYAIELNRETEPYLAIPLIVASSSFFDPQQPLFFDYLQFELYKIQAPYSRLIKVLSTNEGKSLIHYNEEQDFRKQIGDNTDYIIHPDEVLADNFILLLKGEASWKDQSPRGQEILQAMKQIIFE